MQVKGALFMQTNNVAWAGWQATPGVIFVGEGKFCQRAEDQGHPWGSV
jgi:hypothetical protein